MELIKWNNSFSEDVKEITGDDTEEFIHKAKEKKMNKQVEDMKDTNRCLQVPRIKWEDNQRNTIWKK